MSATRRRPPPPVYVLNHYLLVGNGHAGGEGGEGWADPNLHVGKGNLTGKAGEGWAEIHIARREAYGCGDNMRQALNGLSLCVRLGDDPLVTSALGLRLTRDAHERFRSELGLAAAALRDGKDADDGVGKKEKMLATANIILQDQDVLVMVLLLERRFRHVSYYLVYDRSDASLSMASWVPDFVGQFSPVPKRTSDGTYELFLLACECDDDELPLTEPTDLPPFLCVFSPAAVTAAKTSQATCVWKMRRTLSWNVPASFLETFRTDATFSVQGKGFWADLTQGLMYCDLPTASDDSPVDFRCIELPGECQLSQLDLERMLDCNPLMNMTRTIACVGGSIWFVCVHRKKRRADDLVTMWTLELHADGGQWKNVARFHARELWSFDGFKEAGLPEAKVGYPLLTADGALCLVVTGRFRRYVCYSNDCLVDHICTIDVQNKRLLWHGTVHDHVYICTFAFPPDFFQRKKHDSRKRKLDELHTAAGPGSVAT